MNTWLCTGQSDEVAQLKNIVNRGETPDLKDVSPHAVSGVLKLFFRQHPNPLMTFERYDSFLDTFRKGTIYETLLQFLSIPVFC